MKYAIHRAILAAVCACAASPQDQLVIKTGARLVEFNVIAHDASGPVADLKKEDFTILDQGRQRKIAIFHMDRRDANDPGMSSGTPPPSNVFSNRQAVEPNSTILLFDGVNTHIRDQARARLQVIKFIEALRPTDRLAIYSLGRQLQVVHDFSADTGSLIEAARTLEVRVSEADNRAAIDAGNAKVSSAMTGHFAALRGMMDNMSRESSEANLTQQVVTADQALLAIARYFSSVPGRKSLVWVSSAFPIRLGDRFDNRTRFDAGSESASRALMDANVAVYPVDARGMSTNFAGAYSAASDNISMGQARRGSVPRVTVGSNEQATMTLIADRTGGRAFFGNDIPGSIRAALDDSEVTYTLGFYLSQDEMDSKFHETKITVDRKGVDIRSRKGYIAYENSTQPGTSRETVMRQVLFASMDATALPVTVSLVRAATQNVHVTSMLDPKSLTFTQADGQFLDTVDFVIAQQGADGRNLKVDAEVLHLAFTPERYRQVLLKDIQFGRGIELRSEARTIRVMFYDRNSGLIGSARGPLNVIGN